MSPLAEDDIQTLRRKHYQATLISKKLIHEELALFRVRPDAKIAPHQPGQYTTLGLGAWEKCHPARFDQRTIQPGEELRLIRRQYSISHPILTETGELYGEESTELEFYIVLVTGNEQKQQMLPTLTPRLFALEPGDRLYVGEKITGHYTLEGIQPTDTVLFFSTGTGEAPNNYLLWSLLRRSHTGRILSASCVRHFRDLGYWATHKKLMKKYENYQYVALTTREPNQPKKYLQELLTSGELEKLLGKTLDPTQTHVFLCGNPQMIGVPVIDRTTKAKTYPATRGMVELLEQRGFTADAKLLKIRGQVHFEEYW